MKYNKNIKYIKNKGTAKQNSSAAPAKKEKQSQISVFIIKYSSLIFLFLLFAISFIVFKDFIFFKKLYLFKDIGSDSINANYPQFIQILDYLKTYGIPKWSFNQGMGQNILPFSFMDPFTSFLFFFNRDFFAYGLAYAEIAKIILAGFFFFLFLRKLSLSVYSSILGGMLYSFSGFIILGSCWNQFSAEALYLSFLLFGFEKFYQNKNIIFIPVAFALISTLQPLDIYMFGLFLFIYIISRYFEGNDLSIKKFSVLLLKIVGLCLLGVALSSFFLINNIIQILESPRVGGESSFFSKLMSKPIFGFIDEEYGQGYFITNFMRFFSSDILGTGSNFRGWYNYLEAPLFYCGLINLLLFPQIFIFLNKKKKIIYAILITIFIIPVLFPFFRYAFWIFSGDYYRVFSFFVVFILLLNSIKALSFIDKNGKVNFILLLINLIILLIILYYPYNSIQLNKNIINSNLQNICAFFLVLYALLIFLLQYKKSKLFIQSLLFLGVLIELIYFSGITVNDRPVITGIENKQKIGYNDYTVDAINYLNAKDKSFFRINKEYASGVAIHSSYNDAKVQNFKGTPSYYSFNQQYYVKFLQGMNILHGNNEWETRWISGLSGLPLLHGMANIKYTLTKNIKSAYLNFGYDSIYTVGDVKILKNKFYLPLGFTYDKFIRNKNFQKLSQLQKCITINKAFVIDDSTQIKGITEFQIKDTMKFYSWVEFVNNFPDLKKDTLSITEQTPNNISGNIKIDQPKMLFFSIPFDKGWSAIVDGKNTKPILTNMGFCGLLLDKGKHQVELSYSPPYFKLSAIISLIALVIFLLLIFLNYKMKKQSN